MLLSIIIVSYNVKYFLEQCLCSIERAIPTRAELEVDGQSGVEVLVVDNHSSDGSLDYLRNKFSFARFVGNKENAGFSKANNLGLEQAKGKYILFLNPDTILPEDALIGCIRFMELDPKAGALGVRMINGGGHFLKESKRGFPTPWVSFSKMSGLTRLFPSSKLFARYYMGHLKERETNEVDVLSGAFMMVKKDVLDKTGGFDEQFFMYAEDIDLSYRIQQSGYRNYYFPGCTIIHFKGESTIKDGRYIKLFYSAMIQFVRKHFNGGMSWLYIGLLKMVINMRGGKDTKSHKASTQAVAWPMVHMIIGAKESIEEVKRMMPAQITNDFAANEADIFCEGNYYSFKRIIDQLQLLPPGKKAFIHGRGTHSIVGSDSESQQGVAFFIN